MVVDPNIKKKADDIRNKVYGREVRESLASGLEEMSSDVIENEGRQSIVEGRQDSVESQWQAVSDEMTDKDVISAPEIIAARDGEANLKARLDKEHQEVTAQLAQKVGKATVIKQTTMPPKQGLVTNSPKIVVLGSTNDSVKVVQFNGSKYVIYHLDTSGGDTGSSSVGGTWDLIRLKKVNLASNAYVAKTVYDASLTVGTLETLFVPSLRNSLENYLVQQMAEESSSEYISSSGNGFGLGVYSISGTSPSSVTWKIKTGSPTKGNILIYGSSGSSTSADILVNGEVVKSINPTKLDYGFGAHYKIIEFDLPTRMIDNETIDVTLRNNDTSKKLYFSCANFMFLKDYDGRDVDFYKAFGTSSYFINGTGANDYAIYDHNLKKYCGSYHGGETRLDARLMWYTSPIQYPIMFNEGRYAVRSKSVITDSWAIMPQFEMLQITNINGKGRMVSKFNFDTDGTMDMQFGFKGSIVAEDFYTALTCTDVGFTYIGFPNFEELPEPDQKGYLIANEGYVEQQNVEKKLTLAIRHSKFNSDDIAITRENGWIQNHATNYKKYYYGAVEKIPKGVLIEQLTFRKALDFKYA